ncbi:uncharacterized protein F4822DRAFT_423942 [Hypoxylon trugodes]|uniref:uncharacterized protein n=1 Tax=Hypoxylon trugodes TaxID=326681 RepID=UPI00219C9BDB|nr:uncharacterized protein F4822DRAFT_423942 [Hypoxylon trugodes]KAI1393474.1 hypothetical protein F4822DRAFT_423942 [Hypoxylon trugodes]
MKPLPLSQSSGATTATTTNHSITNSSNEYEEALDQLQPLQPILQGFNHRNRNQHRRAAWWASFGMLRRHVDRLVYELLDFVSASLRTKSNSGSKKRKHDEGGRESKILQKIKGDEERLRGHVEWLRDVLVPKCYLAFSQLAADNQFATLGVVLLGALAQVNAACTRVVGETAAEEENAASTTVREPSATAPVKELSNSSGTEPSNRQGGAVISRDAVEKLRRKNAVSEEKKAQLPSDTRSDTTKKTKDHDDDAISTGKQRGVTTKTKAKDADNAPSSEEKVKPPKKKKKTKKGGGDEFDALFKGLF